MSYKDFEVPPRKVVEFTKSKLAKEDAVAKEQINIRVSSRGQAAAAKEAPAPRGTGGAEEGRGTAVPRPQEIVERTSRDKRAAAHRSRPFSHRNHGVHQWIFRS